MDRLVRLEENGVLSRDSDEYAARGFYRAHWQPLWAWCGLVGCIAIMLSSGWPAIYLLRNRHNLVIDDQLKSNALLAADIAGAYSGVCTPEAAKRLPFPQNANDCSSRCCSSVCTWATSSSIGRACSISGTLRRHTSSPSSMWTSTTLGRGADRALARS